MEKYFRAQNVENKMKKSNKKFIFKEHTADMFIEAYGNTYVKALENAALGLFETISDTKKLKAQKKIILKEETANLAELTTYILSKIVSEGDAREMMFKRMKVRNFTIGKKGFALQVEVWGQKAVHKLGRMYVKAMTHHEAQVSEKNGKWTILVLPDI